MRNPESRPHWLAWSLRHWGHSSGRVQEVGGYSWRGHAAPASSRPGAAARVPSAQPGRSRPSHPAPTPGGCCFPAPHALPPGGRPSPSPKLPPEVAGLPDIGVCPPSPAGSWSHSDISVGAHPQRPSPRRTPQGASVPTAVLQRSSQPGLTWTAAPAGSCWPAHPPRPTWPCLCVSKAVARRRRACDASRGSVGPRQAHLPPPPRQRPVLHTVVPALS